MSGKASKVSTEISLDERMTVKNVDDIHHKWQALLSKNTKSLVIDGTHFVEFDCAGLQLILSLVKEAVAQKTKVSWCHMQADLLSKWRVLGVLSWLESVGHPIEQEGK